MLCVGVCFSLFPQPKAELLNEEAPEGEIEPAPDFTDSNVLADLLSDEDEPEVSSESPVAANELEDMEELNSLDFDELLANIEEEAPASEDEDFDIDEPLDIGDDLAVEPQPYVNSAEDTDTNNESVNDDNFVSVDSLLSDSLDASTSEPYDNTNIDVGLNEFPEFSEGANQLDVDDEDDSGIAAKLDLANVYIEIGDSENAEVILIDVVNNGDEQQKAAAQQLLDTLNN